MKNGKDTHQSLVGHDEDGSVVSILSNPNEPVARKRKSINQQISTNGACKSLGDDDVVQG